MSGNPQLIAHLDAVLANRGRIPFSEYMETVLYHPEYGYYSSADSPIGADGDFFTASNVDPAMGQSLAKLFGRMAEGIEGFRVVEIGAGTGLLARHVLETRPFPYSIVERSAAMRKRQRETLDGLEVEWSDTLPGGIRGCVFSNEFFDALPVRRYTRKSSELRELFVGQGILEVDGEPEIPIELPLLQDGAVVDISLEARRWIRRIGQSIEQGYHLAIDYGYLADELFARTAGTLMCYRNHRADEDPYCDIGLKDLTAHVNFSDLISEGAEAGLEQANLCSQREFLIDLGLLETMERLALAADAASVGRLQALKNLLLPPMMGDRFKVLLQQKGNVSGRLPGFGGESVRRSG